MAHPLSLQSSSSNADFEARKTNQRLQPAQTKLTDLPIALIHHAMGFLSYQAVVECKNVSKKVFELIRGLDYPLWMRISGFAKATKLQEYFGAKKVSVPTSSCIKEIRKAGPHLRSLDLSEFSEAEKGFALLFQPLSGEPLFPNLRRLYFEFCFFENNNSLCQNIQMHAPKVTHLTLETAVENMMGADQINGFLRAFTKLESLEMINPIGRDIEALEDLPTLQELAISTLHGSTSLDEEDLQLISRMPKLRHLWIRWDVEIEDGLSCLADAKALKKVTLDNDGVEGFIESIESLRDAKNIEELVVRGGLSEEHFSSAGKCVHLRALTLAFDFDLDDQEPLTDRALAHLASCRELRSLKLGMFVVYGEEHKVQFTTQGIVDLVKKLPHLCTLDLDVDALFQVDVGGVQAALKETHPKLRIHKNRSFPTHEHNEVI